MRCHYGHGSSQKNLVQIWPSSQNTLTKCLTGKKSYDIIISVIGYSGIISILFLISVMPFVGAGLKFLHTMKPKTERDIS